MSIILLDRGVNVVSCILNLSLEASFNLKMWLGANTKLLFELMKEEDQWEGLGMRVN